MKRKSADVNIDPNAAPVKPKLNIVNVNLIGTMYTWKLAVHYFRKQPDTDDRDRCFIITGSLVAWIDSPVCLHESYQAILTFSGELAIHQQQVWTKGTDENSSSELP
jgi:hypothetical protein